MPEYHVPVLRAELIALLDPHPGGAYLDATLGGAGDAEAVLELIGPDGVLVGIDRDPEAMEHARKRLERFGERAVLVTGNFGDAGSILASAGFERIDGAVIDLGLSSHQLDTARGFTFSRDENLDMRMSMLEQDTPTAAAIVNTYPEQTLADLIYRYGEERYSRRIARAIVQRRQSKPITTTGELTETILSAVPAKYWDQGIHPATRTYMALRREVNKDLEALEMALPAIADALKVGARLCVISFDSLEDGIVKRAFRRLSGRCECPPRIPICTCGARRVLRVITTKPITPSAEEIRLNLRSRSAKLRCGERIE